MQRFYCTQPHCCLPFSRIQLQMLLRCCLLHMTIMMRHFLFLVYSQPCLGLVLFMLYLRVLFFVFIFIFLIINHINTLKQAHLFLAHFLEYLKLVLNDNMHEVSE